jgi:DNA processing protein
MNERGLLDLIIARLPGLDCTGKIALCEKFNREEDFTALGKGDVEKILGRNLKFFWDAGLIRALAENDAKVCRQRSIQWVSWTSQNYPPLLREIPDPPALLFFRGRLPEPDKPLIGMVGTRKPSPQAARQAYDIARGLGQRGLSVVSGLALGIDAMSHRGNIEGGACTFAVLGSGADEVYPASNRVLAKRILETGGGIISEYPPGTGPRKWNFPQRNRIVAGLVKSVLIVEAPARSGALITARLALDGGREVRVASAGIDPQALEIAAEEKSVMRKPNGCDRRGTAKLVVDGAKLVSSAEEMIEGMEQSGWYVDIPLKKSEYDREEADVDTAGKAAAFSLAKELGINL